MAYKAQILLGTISKVRGYDGAVTIRLEKNFIENLPEPESVFLEIEGKPVPFFVSDSEYNGGDILWLKFSGYEAVDKVAGFTGCRVFLTDELIETDPEIPTGELTGYKLQSPDNKLYGIVVEVIENPGQLLLVISTKEKNNILVPFHEDLILKIDKKRRIIVMDLPEGLIGLN